MVAVSEVLTLDRPDEPTQVHLAYNDQPFTSGNTGCAELRYRRHLLSAQQASPATA